METRLTREGRAVAKTLLKLGAWGAGLVICGAVLSTVFSGGSEPPARAVPQAPLPPPAMGLTSPMRSSSVVTTSPPVENKLPSPQPSIYTYGPSRISPLEQSPSPTSYRYGAPLGDRHLEVSSYDGHYPKSKYGDTVEAARQRKSTYDKHLASQKAKLGDARTSDRE